MKRFFTDDKQFYKTLLAMGLPMMAQQAVTMLINLVGTVMMGQFGEDILSATALANQFYTFAYNISAGLSAGAAVLAAQYWGKKDIVSMKTVMAIMLKILMAASVIFVTVTFCFPGTIMKMYTNEAVVIAEGVKYLRVIAFAFLFHALSLALTNMLRCAGIVKVPMIASITALITVVIFDWVFIFGNLGAPKLGIIGAAMATLIARVVEFTVIAIYALIIDQKVKFRVRDITLSDKGIMKNYFKNGGPVLLSDFMYAFGNNMLSVIMGHMGSAFTAAVSIVTVITQLSIILTHGVSGPAAAITGMAVGKGEYEKAQKQGVTLISIGLCAGVFICFAILLVKNVFIGLYNIEPGTAAIARQLVTVAAFLMIFNTLDGIVTKGILRGGGDTKLMMICDIVVVWLITLPLGYLTAFIVKVPIWVTYICLRADTILKGSVMLLRFFSKKWIHDVTKQ